MRTRRPSRPYNLWNNIFLFLESRIAIIFEHNLSQLSKPLFFIIAQANLFLVSQTLVHRLTDMVLNINRHILLYVVISLLQTITQILNRIPISSDLIFNNRHFILILLHINFTSLQLCSELLKIFYFISMLLNILLILF